LTRERRIAMICLIAHFCIKLLVLSLLKKLRKMRKLMKNVKKNVKKMMMSKHFSSMRRRKREVFSK